MSPQTQEQIAQIVGQVMSQMNGGQGGAVPPAAAVPPGAPPWAAPQAAAAPAWGQNPYAAPAAVPPPLGWSVAVEFPVMGPQGMGTVNVDISFSADTFAQAPQIIQAMIAQGWKIYVRMPKPAFNANGSGYPPRQFNGYRQNGFSGYGQRGY